MAKYYVGGIPFDSKNCLKHYGIKGQSWGRRRFQNQDGSLTPAGKQRYGIGDFINSARNAANAAYGRAKEAYTGSNYKREADSAYRRASNLRAEASGANRTASQIIKTYGNSPDGYGNANWARLSNAQQEIISEQFSNALQTGSENRYAAKNAERYGKEQQTLYENAPRQKVQKAINKGKDAVEKVQKSSKGFLSKISEMASSAIEAGKSLLKKLFR